MKRPPVCKGKNTTKTWSTPCSRHGIRVDSWGAGLDKLRFAREDRSRQHPSTEKFQYDKGRGPVIEHQKTTVGTLPIH